jgi:hypothetical protein
LRTDASQIHAGAAGDISRVEPVHLEQALVHRERECQSGVVWFVNGTDQRCMLARRVKRLAGGVKKLI